MSILVDTNIFLEILLDQDNKEHCKSFLNENSDRLSISDFFFTFHRSNICLLYTSDAADE